VEFWLNLICRCCPNLPLFFSEGRFADRASVVGFLVESDWEMLAYSLVIFRKGQFAEKASVVGVLHESGWQVLAYSLVIFQ
jgi:hypothetical protein